MDFRYLEFLLTSYSWTAIILCIILVIWLIRLPVTELYLLVVKLKIDPSQHIMDWIVVVMFVTCLQSMWVIQFRVKDEIDHLKQQQFESTIPFSATGDWQRKEDARQAAIKKQWGTLYDELTHSKNTALFAFIRYDSQTNELTECDVQNVVWSIITWVPLLFIGFWAYVSIKQTVSWSAMTRGSIWWPIIGLAAGAMVLWQWLRIIHNDYYTGITRSVLDIALLANGLSPVQ